MNRIAFPLKLQMKSPEVAHLHEALVFLGLTITEAETTNQRYGATTRAAVLQLQTTHNLPASGAVNEATANAINGLLAAQGALDQDIPDVPGPDLPDFPGGPVPAGRRVSGTVLTSMALRSGECRSRHSIAAWVANSH